MWKIFSTNISSLGSGQQAKEEKGVLMEE